LSEVLADILTEEFANQGSIISVLQKANSKVFNQLLDTVMRDTRPEVRQCVLGVSLNRNLLTDHQLTMGLKAFAQATTPLHGFGGLLSVKTFSALRPEERLHALEKYLNFFPKYRQLVVFEPEPSKEEFDMILFAGCIEQNDLVNRLSKTYQEITEELPPKEESEDDKP